MSTTIATASRQLQRPADERFPSVQAMIDHASHQRDRSAQKGYNLKDLQAIADGANVVLQSPRGTAELTHWSYGQLARTVGAPASYTRTLPAQLAADCLNHGIQTTPDGTKAVALIQAPDMPASRPTVRCLSTETYDRVYDATYLQDVKAQIFDARSSNGHSWQNAPTWAGDQIAGFRSDRDMFCLQIDGGSSVNDPSAGQGDGAMYRGILIGNSEVGAGSIWFQSILYRYICGNWMLWSAVVDKTFRRRHVGKHTLRDTIRAIGQLARTTTQRSAAQDEALIRSLISHELAETEPAVLDELRTMGYSREQATDAYRLAIVHEQASPRSFWGIAQGTTRLSQQTDYTNDRFELDMLAAKVLARGARVAA